MLRAACSLPEPLSPEIYTGTLAEASLRMSWRTCSICGEEPKRRGKSGATAKPLPPVSCTISSVLAAFDLVLRLETGFTPGSGSASVSFSVLAMACAASFRLSNAACHSLSSLNLAMFSAAAAAFLGAGCFFSATAGGASFSSCTLMADFTSVRSCDRVMGFCR